MPPALPLVVLAAAMLTLGCAGTPAGDAGDLAPAASEVQTLTFAWPDDLEADVEVRTVRIQDDGRARSERAIDARYRLRSEPRGESLRIVSEGLTLASVDGQPQTQRPADTADDPAGAALLAPTVLVHRDGTLLEVEGIPELRREVAKRTWAR